MARTRAASAVPVAHTVEEGAVAYMEAVACMEVAVCTVGEAACHPSGLSLGGNGARSLFRPSILVMACTVVRGVSMVGVREASTVAALRGASTEAVVWVVVCGTLAVLTDLYRRTGKVGCPQLE